MNVAVGFGAGAIGAAVGWRLVSGIWANPAWQRSNHRGRLVPTGAGLVIVLTLIAGEALLVLGEVVGWELNEATRRPRTMVLIVGLGMALLGLIDDLAGAGESGGFRGHLREVRRGRLTTGGLKLFGGGAVAVVAAAGARSDTVGRVLADAALVALAANLANLFDRAPGRTGKVSLFGFAVLVAATGAPAELVGVAIVAGAGVGLLAPDLRERLMLGDVGANVLGGVLGIGVVIATAPATRTGVLVGLIALNLASEVLSFSAMISRVGPLRALDRWGQV